MKEKHELAYEDYLLGMKRKDIAEKYGVSVNTVKSWATRHKWSKKGAPQKKRVQAKKGASKIAEKHATGTSQEWKLEQDNNQTIWEVKVVSANKETDVKIDAINKKVLHVEKD